MYWFFLYFITDWYHTACWDRILGFNKDSSFKFDLSYSTHKLHTSTNLQLYTVVLASCLIYAWALLEYVILIMWLRSVIKMLLSVQFAEDKVLTFLILCEKC